MENQFSSIQHLLYRLGITPNYAGFDPTIQAVTMCIEQPKRLRLITKWLYPDVAKACGTTSAAVERNIRTVCRVAWQKNSVLLEFLAQRPLDRPPQNTQFLSFLCAGMLQVPAPPPYEWGKAAALADENQDMRMAGEPVNPEGGILRAGLRM